MASEADQLLPGQQPAAVPLRYKGKRAAAGKPDLSVTTGRESPLRTISSRDVPTAITVLTPPLTPQVAFDASGEPIEDSGPGFFSFLRVFYHFSPSEPVLSDSNESSITIAIKRGDLVLVHSVQPNGWADGTVLSTGERGWLPTNYCRGYDHEHIHVLLNSLTYVWDYIRGHDGADRSIFARPDYVRGMIAGVRVLLEHCGCLNRDATPLLGNDAMRRFRKALLSELSSFAKGSKTLQDACVEPSLADNDFYPLLDAVIMKAFKVVIRASRFLDTWMEEAVPGGPTAEIGLSQPRPLSGSHEHSPTSANPGMDSGLTTPSTALLGNPFNNGSISSHNGSTPVSAIDEAGEGVVGVAQTAVAASHNRQSNSQGLAITVVEPATSSSATPLSGTLSNRASASHRLSHNTLARPTSSNSSNLASLQLHQAHDVFLSCLGAFIGLHLESRPSTEILYTTQRSVIACQTLFDVVEAIYQRDFCRSQAIEDSRAVMHGNLSQLVHATKDLLIAAEAPQEELACPLPEQGRSLMDAATMCVRSAGDLVAKSRSVVERIGDFEYLPQTPASQEAERLEIPAVGSSEEKQTRAPSPPVFSKRTSSLPTPREPVHPPPPPPAATAEAPVSKRSSSTNTVSNTNTDSNGNSWKELPAPPTEAPSSLESSFVHVDSQASTPEDISFKSLAGTSFLDVEIPQSSFMDLEDRPHLAPQNRNERAGSHGESVTESAPTSASSFRNSGGSVRPSTRATTPEHVAAKEASFESLKTSNDSFTDETGAQAEEGEAEVLAETHAHELMHNKDGLIIGGSLPALVERLTTHDSTPDALFVTTFYLTFRLFTTPLELANRLIERYDRTADDSDIAKPVRLRVYNVFKGWLEGYWKDEIDTPAIKPILTFASTRLQNTLPPAARRLIDLCSQASDMATDPSMVKVNTSMGRPRAVSNAAPSHDNQVPQPNVSKSQYSSLRNFKNNGTSCTILDLDALELARQFTILQMKTFCAIQPEELLALEWTKKDSDRAPNVRAMSALSTDLANLVADTILQYEAKKRALVIKQWIKIAGKCRDLGNYDALMAIICSLNSSMVLRLKKTWDLVSPKTMAKLEVLKGLVDCSRNYAVLRNKLSSQVAPCLPFVGTYLTDLTFVDAGNPETRQLPATVDSKRASVINFDKHMKTTRIITDLQRFQVPYKLTAVPEMQEWMEIQINRVHSADKGNVQQLYRRSLLLEPREGTSVGAAPSSGLPKSSSPPGSMIGLSKLGAGSQRGAFELWSAKHFQMGKEKAQS